jgi:hypothetical protein
MIKKWRMFNSISSAQVAQLYAAGIGTKIENDVSYLDFPLKGKVPFVKSTDIWIFTTNEQQETLLALLFPHGSYTLEEVDYEQYNEFGRGT